MERFEEVRLFIEEHLRSHTDFNNDSDFEENIKTAKNWGDIVYSVDKYWGWEDEQTVYFLDTIIRKFVFGEEV